MPTLSRRKPATRRKAAGKRAVLPIRKRAKRVLTSEEVALNKAVGTAAAQDLATRSAGADAEDAALINAVARAAARSLVA